MNQPLTETKPVSILDLAVHRGAERDKHGNLNGGEFEKVGLAIMGGCGRCGASLAAYNGYPSHTGYWMCLGCLDGTGYTDVEQANIAIFGTEEDVTGPYSIGYHSSDIQNPHVAFTVDGERDEIFDVALHHNEADERDPALIASMEALELLLARANSAMAVDIDLRTQIKAALEGESNDDEHDALAAVAEALGIEWTPYDHE